MADTEEKPRTAIQLVRHEMRAMIPEFERVLPAHLPSARLARTIETALIRNPYLLECDRRSLWDSAMTAAVLGLEVDGVTGQGYLVPFKRRVQFIPGYKGITRLAFNAGFLLYGYCVRALDAFDYQLGLDIQLNHKPAITEAAGNDNPIKYAYAVAKAPGHAPLIEVMNHAQIIRTRDRSAGYQAFASGKIKSTPWQSDFEAMARKCPIRILGQHLPLEVQKAVEIEAMHDRGQIVRATKMEDGTINLEADDLANVGNIDNEGGDA